MQHQQEVYPLTLQIFMKTKGFTLVETIVYALIVAILFFVVTNTLIVLMRVYNDSRAVRALQDSGLTAIERISREIKQAKSVDLVQSQFGSHPGVLVLVKEEDDGSQSTVQIKMWNGVSVGLFSDDATGPITNPDVEVAEFMFFRGDTGLSDIVRLQLTLRSRGRMETFYTSAIVRGSYSN